MPDADPRCAKCGHKRSQHNYRHPFVGPSVQDTIDAQAATIKSLVEALECIDSDLESRNFLENSSLRDTTRAALAAARDAPNK